MKKIPIIPGRGLVTNTSTKMRLDFLAEQQLKTDILADSHLNIYDINNNIESYIGSTEIPLGIVGPLLFNNNKNEELTYCTVGTLEGALVASMNRGARVISKSGGFSADIKWQKMTRAPMFIFETQKDALLFTNFIRKNETEIKKTAEKYSNHAVLNAIEIIPINIAVHLKFTYTTGDASGQNMTTTCTWHAMLFIVEKFKSETEIIPTDFVIEGNGASDKKVSEYNIRSGRGINVTSKCHIPETILNQVLRTTSDAMFRCFQHSKKITAKDGMIRFNINVSNAIAAIFVSTGQDLASIHESGIGILELHQNNGLDIKLTLPNLVIGTVGGGTSLPKQAQALELMNCKGKNKVERFAKLIAGFTLGLEISTFSAIVSGEFAKAHEKLGRNKPKRWLLRSELTTDFIKNILKKSEEIKTININDNTLIENGILTNIASKINKKLIGFIPFSVTYKNGIKQQVLIKSKALDEEVIKGLHTISASINTDLSDLLRKYRRNLEYKNCHLKEIELYEYLHRIGFKNIPMYLGKHINTEREIYFLVQEFLDFSEMKIANSENNPELWSGSDILNTIEAITVLHKQINPKEFKHINEFKICKSEELYQQFLNLVLSECVEDDLKNPLKKLISELPFLASESERINLEKTIIHNDFNSRNITIQQDGTPIIYDWELSVIDFPHRDIVEFLSFVLPEHFTKEELFFYLKHHFNLYENVSWEEWLKAYRYSLKSYIITRVSFYEVSGILVKYEFSNRVLKIALKMLNLLDE